MGSNGPILGRRSLLRTGAGLAAGVIALTDRATAESATLNMQLGWLGGGNQLGEACAHQLGYFQEEGLDFHVQPGGPNNDGVAIVASGRYEVGEVSSSPSLMLAASQDIPICASPVGAQKHPYTFFSLQKNPVRDAADLVGKKVGIQATGVILLRALLAKNKIDAKDVQIVTDRRRHDAADDRPGRCRHRLAHQHHGAQGAGPDRRRPAAVGHRRAAFTRCPTTRPTDTLSRRKRDMLVRIPARGLARLGLCARQPRQGGRAADEGVPQPQREPTNARRWT